MIDVKTVVQGQRTPRYAPLINDRAKTVLLYRCKYGYHQLQTLVVALMMTKLDYGSATLAGLPAVQLDRLQSVLNAAARLIYRLRSTITCHRCSRNCIGCECLRVSPSGWQFLLTDVSITWRHVTSPPSSNRRATLVTGSVYARRHWPCSMFLAPNM